MTRILIAVFTCCLCSGDSHCQIPIDDFFAGDIPATGLDSVAALFTQAGLPSQSVLGGNRKVTGRSLGSAELSINTSSGRFEFVSTQGSGYFTLTYGSEMPLGVDLTVDGSDAFALLFTDTLIAPYFDDRKRGRYTFQVSDSATTRSRSISEDIFAIDGSKKILIPYSDFPDIDFTNVSQFSFDASRIEGGSQIFLTDISTTQSIPEPRSTVLLAICSLFVLRRNRAG